MDAPQPRRGAGEVTEEAPSDVARRRRAADEPAVQNPPRGRRAETVREQSSSGVQLRFT